MRLSLLLFLSFAVCFSASAVSAQYVDNRALMSRMERMERDLMLLQRQAARGGSYTGSSQGSYVPPPQGAAQLELRITQLEEQIRQLQGSIEEASHQSQQAQDQLKRMREDVDFRLQKLEQGGMASNAPLNPPTATAAPEENTAMQEEPEAASSTPTTESQAPQALRPPGEKTDESPRDMYNRAFKLLRQAKHAEAGDVFEQFLKQYPKDVLAGNAWYWLGETYYVRREYVKAADSFRQGFKLAPTGPKAPDNLLKLAMSLSAMKKNDEACVVLKEVSAKYPDSSVKPKADKEISRIGCEG